MHKLLAVQGGRIDAVFYCPHTTEENCHCRKPQPGLYEQIGARFGMPLKGVPAVGDALRDVLAAAAAGCEPHLVLTGKSEKHRGLAAPAGLPAGTLVHQDLAAFADFILLRSTQAAPSTL